MKLSALLQNKKHEFISLCESHKVQKLYAFGSVVTDKFNDDTSDIDLIVALDIADPLEYGEMLMILWDSFEIFFGRRVDLLTDESINNPYLKKSIEATKKLIYDRQGEKVFV